MPITRTPNLNLVKLPPNYKVWAQLMNDNMTLLDASISAFVSFNNLRGAWANSTAYVVGDTVVDSDLAVLFTCQVDHTSALLPTTFLEDRTDNPTYWSVTAAAAANRGAWQTATAYSRNDFVLADGTKYAMCLVAHTSGANFSADLALGRWTVLVDLSLVGSLVLPVLSGGTDANKVVMSDSLGTAYVINTVTQLLNMFTRTGAGTTIVMDDSPTFINNPAAPTQISENNSTRLATTAYADLAVRALVPRVQTFTASGTYTPHAKMVYCEISVWGGGGGSGGVEAGAAGFGTASGGGGAGSKSMTYASRATIGASQVVTIGAGGSGGAAGNNNGTAGGDTSVGALCIGKGGSPSNGSATGNTSRGGAGGVAGTGDITGRGDAGGEGGSFSSSVNGPVGGHGGITEFGGSAVQPFNGGASAAGSKGGGATGACSQNGGSNLAGAAGGAGYVVIVEYCYG